MQRQYRQTICSKVKRNNYSKKNSLQWTNASYYKYIQSTNNSARQTRPQPLNSSIPNRFADDIDGLGGKEELAKLVERLDKASTAYGMEISAKKTKLMTKKTPMASTQRSK